MVDKFPILDVTKASLLMPFNSIVNMLKAIGLLVAAIVGFVILMFGGLLVGGGDLAEIGNALGGVTDPAVIAERVATLEGAGGGTLGVLLGLFLLVTTAAYVFNFWVRFASFGRDGTAFGTFKRAASAAAVNGFKFILIFILIILVSLVLNFVLSSFGLSKGIMEQAAIPDMTDQYLSGFTFNLIGVVVTCFAYSAFSANLTQTAIGDDQEPLQHPHTMDFAVVLLLIYATLVIPMVIAAFIGSDTLFMAVQYLVGILVWLAIPAAHGLRYRICKEENAGVDTSESTDAE